MFSYIVFALLAFSILLFLLSVRLRNKKLECISGRWKLKLDLTVVLEGFIMIILVAITAFYADETSKIARQAEHANQVTLRPYLVYRPNQIVIGQDGVMRGAISHFYSYYYNKKSQHLVIPYQIHNVGRVPAIDVRRGHKIYAVNKKTNKIRELKNYQGDIDPALGPEETSLSHQDDIWYYQDRRVNFMDEFIKVLLWVNYKTIGHVGKESSCTSVILDLHPKSDSNDQSLPEFSINVKQHGQYGIDDQCSKIKQEEI